MGETRDKIEPCLIRRCWSPNACANFGYCIERNCRDPEPTTPEKIEARRRDFGRASPATTPEHPHE